MLVRGVPVEVLLLEPQKALYGSPRGLKTSSLWSPSSTFGFDSPWVMPFMAGHGAMNWGFRPAVRRVGGFVFLYGVLLAASTRRWGGSRFR